MSDGWNKKKKKRSQGPFDFDEDLFGFMDFEDLMDDLMRNMMQEPWQKKPRVMGFSFKMGPEGKPVIEQFGNVKRGPQGMEFSESREPLIDVIYRLKEIIVTAELPGVQKEKINLKTMKDAVVIDVPSAEPKYHSKTLLKEEIDPKTAKASFKNGVLEIKFKKLKQEEQGTQIEIK